MSQIRFSPSKTISESSKQFKLQVGLLLLIGLVFFHIEIMSVSATAPQSVLVQVVSPEGYAEPRADCFGDVFLDGQAVREKQPLEGLSSAYDVIDPAAFFVNTDKGFFILDTGFTGSEEVFEVRVVCYTPDFEAVSYTVINETNTERCALRNGGTVAIC